MYINLNPFKNIHPINTSKNLNPQKRSYTSSESRMNEGYIFLPNSLTNSMTKYQVSFCSINSTINKIAEKSTPIKELSDAEFQKMLPEVESKLKELGISLPKLNKNNILFTNKFVSDENLITNKNLRLWIKSVISDITTPEQAEVANKFFSHERLYGNEYTILGDSDIIKSTKTPESAQAKISIMDKYLSDESLFENKSIKRKILDIIHGAKTLEQAEAKLSLIDKYISFNDSYYSDNLENVIGSIILKVNTPDQLLVADKYISNACLYNNEYLVHAIEDIIASIRTSKTAQAKISVMDKYVSDKKLYYAHNTYTNIGDIISQTATSEQAEIATKYLSDERLYENKNFNNWIRGIISDNLTREQAHAKISIIDKYLMDKNLYENKILKEKMGEFVYWIQTPKQVELAYKYLSDERLYDNINLSNNINSIIIQIQTPKDLNTKTSIINKYLSDKNLYENKHISNIIGDIIESAETPKKAEMAIKVLSNEKLCQNKLIVNNIIRIIKTAKSFDEFNLIIKMLEYISDKKLYKNSNISETLGTIISSAKTSEQTKIKLSLLENFITDEKLQKNNTLKENIGDITSLVERLVHLKLFEKIFSNKDLSENPNVMNMLNKIFIHTKTAEDAQIVDYILSNERLYNNSVISNQLDKLLIYSEISPEGISIYNKISEKLKLLKYYANGGDIEHQKLIKSALEHKDVLKLGLADITDDDIKYVITNFDTIKTLNLIGKTNTEAAFPLMIDNFEYFVDDVANLKLSTKNEELLRQIINPLNSKRYQKLTKTISLLKKNLSELLSEAELKQIQELKAQKDIIERKIKTLKTEGSADKNKLKYMQNELKTLSKRIQHKYFANPEATTLIEKINKKNKQLNDLIKENKKLNPYEVVTKVQVLTDLQDISTEEEMTELIKLIKASTPENEKAWNEAITKKIFEKFDMEYDEELAQKLDLMHCPYLSKMFVSCDEFYDNMKILINLIKEKPKLSIEEVINQMPQNIETKKLYDELGIDYEKWAKIDKNSYTYLNITLDADTAKQKSIENLEEDLNDNLFKFIPKDITDDIFKRLKQNLGITFEKSQKSNWEGDGFSAGIRGYYRLYKNGKPITFEDMNGIVTEIKTSINSNDFWTTTNSDSQIETARSTLYTHLIKMRTSEVESALHLKGSENVELEVKKTNMYDIKKALCLGNDAQCCTGLGRNSNEWTAPTYIMNKCIGAIELTDRGKFAGNTMIYLAYVDGKPSLILDNIELKTKYQNNDKIRDTFLDYDQKLCAEIGKPDMPIYAGPNRHKLNMDIYPKSNHKMQLIGNSGNQEVYLDYDAEAHIFGDNQITEIEMYKLT